MQPIAEADGELILAGKNSLDVRGRHAAFGDFIITGQHEARAVRFRENLDPAGAALHRDACEFFRRRSLHIDLHSDKGKAGKGRSEVGWLNGAVVRKGDEVGVETPVNQALADILGSLAANPSELSAWRGNHARLMQAVASTRP